MAALWAAALHLIIRQRAEIMRRHGLIIIALYLAIPLAVHLHTRFGVTDDGRHVSILPAIAWQQRQGASSDTDTVPPPAKSLWQQRLDLPDLTASIQRMPGIRGLRQWGNSIRVAMGQEVSWIDEHRKRDTMLFPWDEIWAARGLHQTTRSVVYRAAEGAARKSQILARQGWQLIIMPVPTKLNIYHDWAQWPILTENLIERWPVWEDRTDEVVDLFFTRLRELQVTAIDLRPSFRDWAHKHGCSLYLFPPGETHWSARGIELAAEQTSAFLADRFGLTPFTGRRIYATYDFATDLGAVYDVDPRFPARLAGLTRCTDSLLVGREEPLQSLSTTPRCLIIVAGTSYSGRYWGWTPGVRGDFPFVLSQLLQQVEVQNRSRGTRGPYEPLRLFQPHAPEIAAAFERTHHLAPGTYPKIIIWEFPFRFLRALADEVNR
jgi:hypothetical protein